MGVLAKLRRRQPSENVPANLALSPTGTNRTRSSGSTISQPPSPLFLSSPTLSSPAHGSPTRSSVALPKPGILKRHDQNGTLPALRYRPSSAEAVLIDNGFVATMRDDLSWHVPSQTHDVANGAQGYMTMLNHYRGVDPLDTSSPPPPPPPSTTAAHRHIKYATADGPPVMARRQYVNTSSSHGSHDSHQSSTHSRAGSFGVPASNAQQPQHRVSYGDVSTDVQSTAAPRLEYSRIYSSNHAAPSKRRGLRAVLAR